MVAWESASPASLGTVGALGLWVLGWHTAAVMALGVPRLVPL